MFQVCGVAGGECSGVKQYGGGGHDAVSAAAKTITVSGECVELVKHQTHQSFHNAQQFLNLLYLVHDNFPHVDIAPRFLK